VKDFIKGLCYQRCEKRLVLSNKKVFQMFNVCVAEENLEEGL